jgi:hypothetical protein
MLAECHQLSLDIHLLKLGWNPAQGYLDLHR